MQRILGNTQNTEKWDHLKSYPSEICSQILVCYFSLSYCEVVYFQIFTKYGIICCSVTQSCLSLCDLMDLMNCTAPGFTSFTIPWSLLKIIYIQSLMPCNHLILCHPLLLPSIFCSIRIFSNGLALCIRWPKYRVQSSELQATVLPVNTQD